MAAIAVLFAGLGIGGRATAHPGPGTRSAAAAVVTVRPGDTLWAIASRLSGPSADPRPIVDEIARANGIRGPLVPGQTLQIPVS